MPCDTAVDCAPCKDCQNPPEPVMPRCNVALVDGRYDNASIIVENGCIVAVEPGRVPQYTPDVCCSGGGGGGGGGGEGPQGEKGDPGENATLDFGVVTTLSPGSQAYVRNVGTSTHAILDLGIPKGEKGDPGFNPSGVTSTKGGLSIDNGSITGLPAAWPPALFILPSVNTPLISFEFSPPDQANGIVNATLDISRYDEKLRADVNEDLVDTTTPMQEQINQILIRLATLDANYAALDARVRALESKP